MKIGLYCSGIQPEGGGGYTFQYEILENISRLSEETRHTFVIFIPSPKVIHNLIASPTMKLVSLPSSSLFKRDLLRFKLAIKRRMLIPLSAEEAIASLRSPFERLARAHGIQMIWFPTAASIPVDLPYVATVLDLQHRLQPYFPEVGEYSTWKEREIHFSQYLQRASLIIIGSKVGQEQIERFYQIPTERIRILPHPTPRFALESFPEADKTTLDKYDIPKGFLLYPAQFWAHKNHANLLLALQILRQKERLVLPIVFVGSDMGNEAYIRKMVQELDLTSQVRILGFIPRPELVTLYQNAFALTYMTFFGPDNLPPLEAFALGCPVIASDVPGAYEQLNDAVLLVDPKSPGAIAKGILTLYRDPNMRDILIRRGKERSKQWTGKDFVRGMFAILDEFESIRRCWE